MFIEIPYHENILNETKKDKKFQKFPTLWMHTELVQILERMPEPWSNFYYVLVGGRSFYVEAETAKRIINEEVGEEVI